MQDILQGVRGGQGRAGAGAGAGVWQSGAGAGVGPNPLKWGMSLGYWAGQGDSRGRVNLDT